MATLVTGGCGYIGSHMVHELAEAGESVIVLDNLVTGSSSAIPLDVPLIVGDAGDRALVCQLISEREISAIIHFAGSVVVPESVCDPIAYYRNNTMNSCALIESAVRCGIRHFVFSSTAAIYGNPDRVPVPEDAPARPLSPYGTSKLMTELMLSDAAAAHDIKFAILRYFNVAGADPLLRTGQRAPSATHLITAAARTAIGLRSYLDVFGTNYPTKDGTCIRDYIHVSDLVNAHSCALNYLRDGGQSLTLNCGYGRGYSVLEVIAAVERAAGGPFPVRLCDRRPGDAAVVVADPSRLKTTLEWKPKFDDLDTIARHAVAWERKIHSGEGAEAHGTR
jgi:UDP-glucose 4-epimerase